MLFLLYLPSAFLPQTAGPSSVSCTDLLSPGSSPGHFPTGENHKDLHLDFFYSEDPVWQQGLENYRHQESLLSWPKGRGVRDISAAAGIGRRRGLTTEQIYRAMSQLEECYTTHQFRCSTWIPHLSVWVPSWDAVDCNPGGIPSLLQGADDHRWAIWRFILWCHFCSFFLTLSAEFGGTCCQFSRPRFWWERGRTADDLGGACVGGWVETWFRDLLLNRFFSTLFFCRSVTAMHLPFKIALPKLNFFST